LKEMEVSLRGGISNGYVKGERLWGVACDMSFGTPSLPLA